MFNELTDEEKYAKDFYDSHRLDRLLAPVDMIISSVRGTLLWVVINKVTCIKRNIDFIVARYDEIRPVILRDSYREVEMAYQRSACYRKRRDEELPKECANYMFIKGRKTTDEEVISYFNNYYRAIILPQNQVQQEYQKHYKDESSFGLKFIDFIFNPETRQAVEDFLFIKVYSEELSKPKQIVTHTITDANICRAIEAALAVEARAKALRWVGIWFAWKKDKRLPEVKDISSFIELMNSERFKNGHEEDCTDTKLCVYHADNYFNATAIKDWKEEDWEPYQSKASKKHFRVIKAAALAFTDALRMA